MKDLNPQQNAVIVEAMWKTLRERYDGNVAEMSRALHVSQPAIWKIIHLKGGCSFATASAFADLIGVSLLELLSPPTHHRSRK